MYLKVFFFFVITSCVDTSLVKEIKFYRRDFGGGAGGEIYYHDKLYITNYRDGSMTANELYKLSKQYIDTVSSKFVRSVEFLGETPNDNLPKPNFNNSIFKYRLILFGFNRDSITNEVLLSNIGYRMKGKIVSLSYSLPSEKRKIDSILHSVKPFINGF